MARHARRLNSDKLREFARAGAELTARRLHAEILAIERAFPEFALPQKRRALRSTIDTVRRRTYRMSAEARKAVSTRMTRYWAERRKALAKAK